MTKQYGLNEVALDKLNQISQSLNESTNELNNTIKIIEERLVSMSLGVSAWTDNSISVEFNGNKNFYKIGFCRFKDNKQNKEEWRIVYQKVYQGQGDKKDGYVSPLLYSPRIIRMEGCKLIDELINKLLEKAEKFLTDISDTNESLSTSAAAIQKIS